MTKRTAALFFISMAYFIIMAHAVVPHHHHNEWICIQSSHCADAHHSDEKSTSEHDHEDDCILVQLVVRPASQDNQVSVPDCLLQWNTDAVLPAASDEQISGLDDIQSHLIPLPASSYILFASAALVMRAPPAA